MMVSKHLGCDLCRDFVGCESPKQYFHGATGIACEEFRMSPDRAELVAKLTEMIGDAAERAVELEVPADEANSFVAAWLLREGVLLPPVKIGQTVYAYLEGAGENGEDIIDPWIVMGVRYFKGVWHAVGYDGEEYELGSRYCKLTREGAEAMKGGAE